MSEIAQRLTDWRDYEYADGEVPHDLLTRAANLIRELQAENKRLERREFGLTTKEAIAQLDAIASENSRLRGIIRGAKDFDEMADDGHFESPHPVFQLAAERDEFMEQHKAAESALREVAHTLNRNISDSEKLTRIKAAIGRLQ